MRLSRLVAIACAAIIASGTAFAASSSADQSIAQSGLVTLQDLPPGWISEPRTPSGVDVFTSKLVPTIPGCKPVRPLVAINKAATKAGSPNFTRDTSAFSNTVAVYADAKRADLSVAAIEGKAFGPCYQQLVDRVVRELAARSGRITEVNVTVQRVPSATSVGDNQAAATATVAFQVRGQRVTLSFEVIVVRVGRALDTFAYQNNSGPISDTMGDVIAASVSRLRAALDTSRASAH